MAGFENIAPRIQLASVWRPVVVNAFAGVASPTGATEDLVCLGTPLGLLKEVSPAWSLLVVMSSDGFLW